VETRKVNNRLPIAWEGIPFVLGGVALTALFFILDLQLLAIFLALLTLFTGYFFRDPNRNPVDQEKAVLTPADGRILTIRNLETGDSRSGDKAIKISIFMSVLNAHINRMPVSGRVSQLAYHPGRFFSANLDKASLHNENNVVTLETDSRKRIILVQIAGLIARRIVCWVKTGDYVQTGQRFGLIRFGSRLEVYLPPDTAITVSVGQKVKAGQTVLGYLS
jgi:phosphatidylserine decarboxylase